MEINIGDIVRRKTGGPDMTVEIIFDGSTEHSTGVYHGVKIGNILCYWLRDLELCRAVFRPEDIEVVEKSSKPFI